MQGYDPLEEIDGILAEMAEPEQPEQTVFTGAELLTEEINAIPMLLEPLLPSVGTGAIVGIPDSGKSQFCRQLAIAVTSGAASFLDMLLLPRHCSAIYVFTEDSEQAVQFCFQRQCKGMNISSADNMESLHFVKGESYLTPELTMKLECMLQEQPADLVVIDAFGDVFMGQDSSSNVKMRETVKVFNKIAQKYQLLVLFVHHVNKSAYHAAPEQSQVQGGSGFVQKVRVVLDLRNGEGDEKYLFVTKGNYVSREHKQRGKVLLFDEESLLFSNTGEYIDREELQDTESLGRTDGGTQVDWSSIFLNDIELPRKSITAHLMASYGMSLRTAARVINRDLIKAKRGVYRQKDF